MNPFGPEPPWQLGLATAVLAAVVLWRVSGRLRLRPETRAASTALFACGALLAQLGTETVDGRATLLLAAAAAFASAGRRRSLLAALACAGAVVVAPVVAVGLLVLLGLMALTRDLAARLPRPVRWLVGGGLLVAAAGVATVLGRGGDEPVTVAVPVAAGLLAAAVLVGGVLWTRLPWIRPPVGAVAALAACVALPDAGPAAVLPVTAGVAVLAAVLVEEHRRIVGRPALVSVSAVLAGVVLTAVLLPDAAPAPVVRPAAAQEAPAARVVPVSFAIPALHLSGPLGELHRADDGELLAPDDPQLAGWYSGGVVPGDVGPAVLGGHVDSKKAPGVFFRLRALRPGDRVSVTRSDGRVVRFTVTRVREVAKNRFPTTAVYAPTPRPELRLVTCGGRFDRAARSYVDNIVVEAVTDGDAQGPVQRN